MSINRKLDKVQYTMEYHAAMQKNEDINPQRRGMAKGYRNQLKDSQWPQLEKLEQ